MLEDLAYISVSRNSTATQQPLTSSNCSLLHSEVPQ